MRKCLSGFIPLMLLASTVSAADSQSADDGAIAKGNALRHPAGAKAKNGVTLEEPAGFAGTITDAGVIKNLTYQEKPIANDVFVLAGDGGISGGADKRLAFNQNTAAKGRAKVTKNADGSVSSVVDFPVKGASAPTEGVRKEQ